MTKSIENLCAEHGMADPAQKARDLQSHGLKPEDVDKAAQHGLRFKDYLDLITEYGGTAIDLLRKVFLKIKPSPVEPPVEPPTEPPPAAPQKSPRAK